MGPSVVSTFINKHNNEEYPRTDNDSWLRMQNVVVALNNIHLDYNKLT